ncbi:type II toxin-antitoxin system HicA family toxin [Mycolicibacterium aubagnense]|uniref:Type II toxin-antitoxin system HicA family toxin n=1 Tax=Mycolicibacterium aubagnense TaxID=319707 RepID=A0ABN5YPE7_9MYCO|nr:type II toxin-antitoxin system HicA family toxin [Mycolicibacterium aubagnense]TLH64460.1 hypothetical protein C1S80_12395 [Mycolicibacterium aubagnense]BBX82194.1 hypothetical protein MAUB_00670 [Mycolicibacterium aubagnense]
MSSADYKKRLKSLIAQAESSGWAVTKTNNGHWRFAPSDKNQPLVIAPGTTSDTRGVANLEAQLRRSGLET